MVEILELKHMLQDIYGGFLMCLELLLANTNYRQRAVIKLLLIYSFLMFQR